MADGLGRRPEHRRASVRPVGGRRYQQRLQTYGDQRAAYDERSADYRDQQKAYEVERAKYERACSDSDRPLWLGAL